VKILRLITVVEAHNLSGTFITKPTPDSVVEVLGRQHTANFILVYHITRGIIESSDNGQYTLQCVCTIFYFFISNNIKASGKDALMLSVLIREGNADGAGCLDHGMIRGHELGLAGNLG